MNSVIDMGDNQETIYLPVRSFVGQNHYAGGQNQKQKEGFCKGMCWCW